jgi:hypothetical protein
VAHEFLVPPPSPTPAQRTRHLAPIVSPLPCPRISTSTALTPHECRPLPRWRNESGTQPPRQAEGSEESCRARWRRRGPFAFKPGPLPLTRPALISAPARALAMPAHGLEEDTNAIAPHPHAKGPHHAPTHPQRRSGLM